MENYDEQDNVDPLEPLNQCAAPTSPLLNTKQPGIFNKA
jgi:hypothetical protein